MREFFVYIRLLVQSMANFFSIVSLLVFAAAIFVPFIESARTPLLTLSVAAAFLFAGYSCWKRERRETPELDVVVSDVKMRSAGFTRGGAVLGAKMEFRVDVRNRSSEETCTIDRLAITEVNVNSPFLGQNKLPCYRQRSKAVRFPLRVAPMDLEYFTASIEFPITTSDPREIADALESLGTFSAGLAVNYLYPTKGGTEQQSIRGSFDSFKDGVIAYWNETDNFELLYRAGEKKPS